MFEAIQQSGATVAGISRDSPESHRRFSEANELPFPLITDPAGEIANLYGVRRRWLRLLRNKRATFVIDREGVIRGAFHHEIAIRQHVLDVLAALENIGETPR